MEQQVEGRQQAGRQAHKPSIAGEFSKATPVLLSDAVEPEMLEILVGRDVKQHHDEQHLGAGELASLVAPKL